MTATPGRNPLAPGRDPNELFCMPRRYGVGTLLVISTFYACLISLMQWLQAPWTVIVWFCLLFLVIGLFQMFSRPAAARFASIFAGFVFVLAFGVLWTLLAEPDRIRTDERDFLVCCSVITGPLVGYLGGAIVGGVFLIMDAVERWLQRWLEEDPLDAILIDPPRHRSKNSDESA